MTHRYEKTLADSPFIKKNNEDGTHSFIEAGSQEIADWIADGNTVYCHEEENLANNANPNN
jgi:hypothetical protein